MAHRVAAEHVDSELRILWMREMLGGIYRPRWVLVRMGDEAVRAITFVANRAHPRYVGRLPEETIARRIARAAAMERGTRDCGRCERTLGDCAAAFGNRERRNFRHRKLPQLMV